MADRQNIVELVKNLLFPKFCAGCGQEGSWLCEKCLPEVNTPKTEKAAANLDGITALFDYGENAVSKLIKMFKYNYLLEIAGIFEKIITNTKFSCHPELVSGSIGWQGFTIIPVPLHARRERERGFNQAEIIANLFSEKLGLSMNKDLHRVIYTAQQAKLSGEERRNNLKDAFVFPAMRRDPAVGGGNFPYNEVPKKVLLVDDVFTTGATMQECAKVLKNNGVKIVWGLVLASG